MKKHRNVVNERDIESAEASHGERFGYRRKSLGAATGGEKLEASIYEVPPEKKAWPRHYHLANEEAIYILEGEGTLRIGAAEIPVLKGDFDTLPAGEEGAHHLVNTSEANLTYLRFSTMDAPDVMVYPDSDKLGVFGGAAPGGPKEKRTFSKFLAASPEVEYFDGEE
ncbi:MAG: cupin domain-containing protein [Rubrobacter sp.]|nr:cupin domain-containing protein [Rubrobacter sp.]